MQTRQWSENTIKKEKRFRAVRKSNDIRTGLSVKEVDVVVTQRVREEVQRHFGCEKLNGAELEDQGEEGTALTHWEKRLFENEAMTGTHTQNPIYSRQSCNDDSMKGTTVSLGISALYFSTTLQFEIQGTYSPNDYYRSRTCINHKLH